MKHLRLHLVLVLASLAFSPALRAESPDAAFEKMSDDFIQGYLAWRPLEATGLGFHEYDGKITDFSRLSLDAEVARLKRFDAKLQKLDPATLTPRVSIDLRILRAGVRKQLFEMGPFASYTRNPMTYAQALDVNVYVKRNFAPVADRVRSIIAVEGQAENIVAAAKANLDDALPKPYVELAIDVAKGAADFLQNNLTDPLKDLKDDQVRAAFNESNGKAIAALRDYVSWLEKEKLPKAVPDFALGTEKYHQMLADTELVDLPPEKILEIGLAELKHQQTVFAEAAHVINPSKSPAEVFKEIQNDHPTAQSLIPDVAKDLEQIRKFLTDHKVITLPSNVRAQVAETPQYQRATSFASMDTPGPFEKKATEAFYYVTPVENEWPEKQKNEWLTSFNYYTTDVVSIHEAYPGHYVQFLHLSASPASKTAKIFGSYAFIEGWAHYCEQMLIDEGYGGCDCPEPTPEQAVRAAKFRMAQADEALLRASRLCVSIKMHTQGMSVDDGTKFFQDNCYYEEKPARSEAMRGTYDPGYLNYTLGKLQILKLRADFKEQQGDKFSLENFHNEMLNHGMPPIRLLREVLLKDKAKWPDNL